MTVAPRTPHARPVRRSPGARANAADHARTAAVASPDDFDRLVEDLVDAGSREHYADPALYDYEYRRRRADVNFYRELAQRTLGGPGRILDLGAGTGRVTIPLARDGHRVTAVDQSPAMLERLRERVAALPRAVRERIEIVAGDLRTFALPPSGRETAATRRPSARASRSRSRPPSSASSSSASSSSASSSSSQRDACSPRFPLVIAAFNVLEHLYTRSELAACLARVADHLEPDGVFAFDVQMPDLAWLVRDPEKRWAKTRFTDPTTGRAMFYSTNHDYDPVSQIVLIRLFYDPADGRGRSRVVKLTQRKFFPAELEALVSHAGFRVVETFGDFSFGPLDAGSESQVLVCRKA